MLERFTVLFYDKTSYLESVNKAMFGFFLQAKSNSGIFTTNTTKQLFLVINCKFITVFSLLGCPSPACEASSFPKQHLGSEQCSNSECSLTRRMGLDKRQRAELGTTMDDNL